MMKAFITLSLSFVLFFSCTNASKSTVEKTAHVFGNCEKCKVTIDKAAKIKGVSYANWNVDSKLITLKLDTTVTSTDAVLKAIAAVGYDNEVYHGDDYAYDKLPQCCQYERKSY